MIITVQCPACETSFPVDPRKVPEGGVKVRCSSCAEIFFVDKPAIPSVADLAPEPEELAAAAAATAAAATVAAAATSVATADTPSDEVPRHHESADTEGAADRDAALAAPPAAPGAADHDAPAAGHDAAPGALDEAPAEAAFEEQASAERGMDVAESPIAESAEPTAEAVEAPTFEEPEAPFDASPDEGAGWQDAPEVEAEAEVHEDAWGAPASDGAPDEIVAEEASWDSDDAWDSDGSDPWGGEMDMVDADAPEAEFGADPDDSPEVERLETVEDVTRAAAAEYPADDSFDATDDWAETTPAAEAPIASHFDAPGAPAPAIDAPEFEAPDAGLPGLDEPQEAPGVEMSMEAPAMEMQSPAPEGLHDAGPTEGDAGASAAMETGAVTLEVAAPPAPEITEPSTPAPAAEPAKFQFGRRDPHDKARRLARVLVSDIITYNPDRHQQALEQASLHADFEDEIRKSWAEYVEQVGRELAESTPYWFDALNEILARGQKVF